MRQIPGVPMVYIRRAVMIMEPPSRASLEKREVLEREKLGGLEGSKRKRDGEEDEGRVKKKKKGPKEPNPLSVKKKKSVKPAVMRPAKAMNEDKATEGEQNVIGEVTDSVRRHKSTRRRKHTKKASTTSHEIIPTKDGEE